MKFRAKVTSASVDSTSTDTLTDAGDNPSFASAMWAGSLSRKTSFSSDRTEESEHSFTMSVKAVQDEMPTGLARILSILEDAISHDDSS